MDHHYGDIGRQRALAQLLQPLDLTTRTIEALDAMGAAQRDQQAFGARIAKHRDIGAQGLAERPFERVRILSQCRPGRSRRRKELFTLGAVARLGRELGLHICLLLIF
ncbi:hypothetical protein D3C87_1402770 [compost metagenome]